MTLTQHVDPAVYNGITAEVMDKINNYIEAPMTATWFSDKDKQDLPTGRSSHPKSFTIG